MEMLSVQNSRRRRRRSISLADDNEKQNIIISDHKVVTCENLQTGALASQSQPQQLQHQQRRRRAKSEVNTKRNRIDSSDPLVPEHQHLHHHQTTLTRSSNNMLKLPFGSPKRKRTLSEAEAIKLNNDTIKQSNNTRTISEGSSNNNKDDKNHNNDQTHGKKVTWHRRSASTGSPQPIIHVQHEKEKSNLLLKVPGLKRNSLTRAKSEDRLYELEADKAERKRSTPEHRRRSATAALEKAEVHWGDTPGKQNEEIDQHHHGHQRGVAALFARQMLQYSYPLVSPPPIVVEDPPSSDDAGDEKLGPSRRRRNAKINGSSGSSGSGSSVPGAKSAPPTPHGDRLQPGSSFPPASTPDPPLSSDQPPPRSPSHIFTKNDKQALKQLSSSTLTMTAAPPSGGAPEPEVVVAATPPGSSKARQKKFHRHFKQVAAEERVLNYYSCALVSDILLQGHLYITKNYFAFYSNVFGYVTKLLIPTASVLKVSKEKTAKIIPNAVGIATLHEKHVFGSLLSRDATYKLMIQVWKTATEPEAVEDIVVVPKLEPSECKEEVISTASVDAVTVDDEDSSLSGSGNDDSAIERSLSPTPIDTPTDAGSLSESKDTPRSSRNSSTLKASVPDGPHAKHCEKLVNNGIPIGVTSTSVPIQTLQNHIRNSYNSVQSMPRPTFILLVSTGLLAMLFVSAALLLYRISAIQSQFAMHPVIANSGDVYQEILKWQIQLHSKSSNEVQQFLNNNLDQIAKVRQSLEALSLLIVSEDEIRQRHQHSHPGGGGGGGPSVADLAGEVTQTQESSRGAS